MAQFDIYPGRGEGVDFLLDLQDEMLEKRKRDEKTGQIYLSCSSLLMRSFGV
jgi:hypothetical protein